MVLLVVFLVSSAGLAVAVSRIYSEPLNRAIRSSLRVGRIAAA